MQKRIEMNRKVMDLLLSWRVKSIHWSVQTAQEYIEWSLEEAWKWVDRHPDKEIKGYVDV